MANARIRLALDGVQGVINGLGQVGDRINVVSRSLSTLSVLGIGLGVASLGKLATGLYSAAAAAENLNLKFKFSFGENAGKDLNYVKDLANALGLDLISTATAYGQLAAAARGTSLEGDGARAIFESISKASAVMGLSADQSSGALNALQQMISKGTVAAEELRGQLGERLPGAFQIAARAMGVTTQELGKMLEQGQVIADDFLPKFAAQLNSEIGGASEDAADRLDAATNRMWNSLKRLTTIIAESGIATFFKNLMKSGASDVNAVSEAMERAKNRGSGTLGQLNAGAGMFIGKALALNTFTDEAKTLDQQLASTIKKIADLQAHIESTGKASIYTRSDMASLQKTLAQLTAEQQNRDKSNAVNPQDERLKAMGKAREVQIKAEKQSTADLAAIRQKLSGVDASYLPTLEKLQALRASGTVSEKEYISLVSELAASNYKKTDAAKGAEAATHKEATAYTALITTIGEKIAAGKLEIIGYDQLSESQKLTIKLDEAIKTGKKELTPAHIANAKAMIAERAAQEAVIAANKQILADMEARNSLRKSEQDGIDAYFQSQQEGYNAAVKGSNDALKSAQAEYDQFGMSKSQIAEITLLTLESTKAKYLDGSAGAIAIQQQIDAQNELIGILKKTEVKEEYKKVFDSIDSTAHDTFVSIFDSGKSAFDRLRDTLKNGLLDLLYQMTVKKWIFNIAASVTGGASGVANAASSGGSMLSSASDAYGLYSKGSQALSWIGGIGATAGTAGAMGGAAAVGSLGTISATGGTIGMTASGTLGMSALGGTTGMTAAGGAAAGTLGGTAASGGIGAGITSTLAAIPVWGWAALAAVAVASIFGGRGDKEVKNRGVEGSFGNGGFAGNNFSNWTQDGGWFHGDRSGHDTSALDQATAKQFSDSYATIKATASGMASTLGLSADSIANYSEKISLTLGSDAAKNQEIIAKAFSDLGDHITTKLAPDIASFAKEGEAASATLQRLSGAIVVSNAWLSVLRQRLFQVSLAGGDAASKLADAFGGLDGLTAASKAFYETYYTEGERAARSQEDMAAALAKVNLAMPTTKDALRALAGTLDLNTESGRAAYATLLTIAPEFAAVADITAKLAKETADKLIATFTGRGQLMPALDTAALKTQLLSNTLTSTYTAAGSVSTLFLDVNSGLITFGSYTTALTGGLTGAQHAADFLQYEMVDLGISASGTKIDIAGLSSALDNVNTETFVVTIGLVFENLAGRIKGTIDDIGAERIALREAALQIINPTVMTKAAIQHAVSGINIELPSNSGIVSAQNWLQSSGSQQAAATNAAKLSQATAQSISAAAVQASAQLVDATAASKKLDASAITIFKDPNFSGASGSLGIGANGIGSIGNDQLSSLKVASGYMATLFEHGSFNGGSAAYTSDAAGVGGFNDKTSSIIVTKIAENAFDVAARQSSQALANANAQLAQSQQSAAADSARKTIADANYAAALEYAKAQQLAYADTLQNFAIDAGKSVGKLSKLREETVKYYEVQKQLSDMMTTSAAGLRGTVADYRYSQLSDAQQFDKLQSDYAKAYAMALSTDGETLAGYGNTLNSALNPLLEKAKSVLSDTAYNAFAATALARAEAIAGRLEVLTPTDYAADSLAMLGTIDATLAALDASARSAEQIISAAVNAGSDKTAAGLHAVIAALTGQSIPVFSSGGDFGGGLRIVGENGPELEATGASRIFNASQTRNMLGGAGNTARLEALVERQTQELSDMRAELRAIASSNAKMARQADRNEINGVLVRTDADILLNTVAA